MPLLPTPENQSVENWHAALNAAVPKPGANTTVIHGDGHFNAEHGYTDVFSELEKCFD